MMLHHGYKQPSLDANTAQVGKMHKGAKNDHGIGGSSDEILMSL